MVDNYFNIKKYNRFNFSESLSDIKIFLNQYKERIKKQYKHEEEGAKTPFKTFDVRKMTLKELNWLEDNEFRFIKDTANVNLTKQDYLSECGYIFCMTYTPDGENILVGHSTGLIQLRHGGTGVVLYTLRNIQFPPKAIHSLEYSKTEDRICYAACSDGVVYRIEVPEVVTTVKDPPAYCIRADPALECLYVQFYGAAGICNYANAFNTQRTSALSLGLTADGSKMAAGYSDASIKVYDIATQETVLTYKVLKLRLQFIPKKLQRTHAGQVCALRCHPQKPFIFASGSWDKTLRIWDVRCKVGCVMTFEGVDICSDSIDLCRDQCIAGSWKTTEALTVWDLVARKRLNIIRVQNRRPDVDGEYIYACRYWNSVDYNRKGKYGIIGGSGTNCVEVINLHNRYITCSYPAQGTILALTSFQERIAFGGTASSFNIVKFHDPKHEKAMYEPYVEPDYDYAHAVPIFQSDDNDDISTASFSDMGDYYKPAISAIAPQT